MSLSESFANPRQLDGLQLAILDLRLWRGRRMYPFYGQGLTRIGRNTILKHTHNTLLSEARTMDYLARNSKVPVPRVYDVFYGRKGQLFIEMEYINSPELEKCWGQLDHSSKEAVIRDLSSILQELRALPPVQSGVASTVDGAGCWDSRLFSEPFGPFKTESAFHERLGLSIILKERSDAFSPYLDALNHCADRASQSSNAIVLTHGDLAPRNILYDPVAGKIRAIIDWESAGYFPEYWEYIRMAASCRTAPEWWELFQKSGMEKSYEDELQMQEVLSTHFTWV